MPSACRPPRGVYLLDVASPALLVVRAVTETPCEAAWIEARTAAAVEECCHPDSRDHRWFERGWNAAKGEAPEIDVAALIERIAASADRRADHMERIVKLYDFRLRRLQWQSRWIGGTMAAIGAALTVGYAAGWLPLP